MGNNRLFDLTGQTVLLIGGEGNLGPIWKETIEQAGGRVFPVGLPDYDLRDAKDIEELKHDVIAEIGCPDIIICNAAIDTPPSVKEARFMYRFRETLTVNLVAHCEIIDAFIEPMKLRGSGRIVFIGSMQGYIGADWRNYEGGFEKPLAYNLSKAALQQAARSYTVQYGRFGITAVCPGFGPYITGKLPPEFLEKIVEKIPTRKTVTEKSLRQTILYACCCESLAGEDWLVDGGFTKW